MRTWRVLVVASVGLSVTACADPGKWDRMRMSNAQLDRVQAGSLMWQGCVAGPGATCGVSILDVIEPAGPATSTCGASTCVTSASPSTSGPTTINQSYSSSSTSVTQTQVLPPVAADPRVNAAQDAAARRIDWLLRPR